MKNFQNYISLVSLLILSLLGCIITFSAFNNALSIDIILSNLALNMPICLLISYLDYKIISYLQHWHKVSSLLFILERILIADILVGFISFVFLYITGWIQSGIGLFLHQILPIMLWNSLAALIIELSLYNNQLLESKIRLTEIERQKAMYQFEALKNQINPHFLFNSLNVLSALTYQDAGKANLFVKKLSSVYRYLLTTQDMINVPLQEELDFVKSYVFLEQIRFGESLHIELNYNDQSLNKSVVPASIQMLVENALKHNINTKESPLRVYVSIDNEYVTVTNNLQRRSSVCKNGKGLENLKEQYRINGKSIKIKETASEFMVTLPLL